MKVELSSADKRFVDLRSSVPTGAFARNQDGDLFIYVRNAGWVGITKGGVALLKVDHKNSEQVEILPKGTRIALISEV